MRKSLFIFIILFFSFGFGIFYIYNNLPKITSSLLSRKCGFPVTIQELEINRKEIKAQNFSIFNLTPSPHDPALSCSELKITTTFKQVFGNTLTIDRIWLKNTGLNIQFFDAARQKNNFLQLFNAKKTKTSKSKGKSKPYLIKKIVLQEINVKLIFADGKTREVTIPELVFTNITDKSGFPIEDLEKAILHAIIRSVFDKLGLKNLLKTLSPENLIQTPQKVIPNFLPF